MHRAKRSNDYPPSASQVPARQPSPQWSNSRRANPDVDRLGERFARHGVDDEPAQHGAASPAEGDYGEEKCEHQSRWCAGVFIADSGSPELVSTEPHP